MSISCGGNRLRTADGGVDLFLEENIEQRPEHGDRGKLAYLVPCWRDGRSENVRGELELEPDSEPPSEVESELVAEDAGIQFRKAQRWVGLFQEFGLVEPAKNESTCYDQR